MPLPAFQALRQLTSMTQKELNNINCHLESVIKRSYFPNIRTVGLSREKPLQMRKIHWHLNTDGYICSQESTSGSQQKEPKTSKSPNCPVLCQQHTDPACTGTAGQVRLSKRCFHGIVPKHFICLSLLNLICLLDIQ